MYIAFDQFGLPQQMLKLGERKLESPNENELTVRMLARPINPSDLIPITGAYAHRIALPCIPGYEGVGIVEAVGAAVDPAWLGKRVLPLRGEGTWQQYVKAPSELAVPIPDWMDDATAAQLYINPVTAWVMLTSQLGLRSGDSLLINAASSAIGRTVAQMCLLLGFRLIAITSSMMLEQELLALGAAHVLDAAMDDIGLRTSVMQLTNGQGADAAIDCIGGSAGNNMAACLRMDAIFISLGLLSGKSVDWKHIHQNLQLRGKLFHLRHWNESSSTEQWHHIFNSIIALIQSKQLALPSPSASFALPEIEQAIALHESKTKQRGKVMLT